MENNNDYLNIAKAFLDQASRNTDGESARDLTAKAQAAASIALVEQLRAMSTRQGRIAVHVDGAINTFKGI